MIFLQPHNINKSIICGCFLLLSACANNQRCNPALDTDFSSMVSCTVNGGFKKAVSNAQVRLDNVKKNNDQLRKESNNVIVEKESQKKQIQDAENELFLLERNLEQIEKKLLISKKDSSYLKKQILDVRYSLKILSLSVIKRGSDGKEREQLSKLIKRKESLEKALNHLIQ